MQDNTRTAQLFPEFRPISVDITRINGLVASVYLSSEGSNDQQAKSTSSGLSKGAIAGIVIAAVVGSLAVLLSIWALVFFRCGRGTRSNLASTTEADVPLRSQRTWQYVQN